MEALDPVTGHGVSVLETQGDGGTGPSDWSWGQCFRDTRYKSAVLSFVAVSFIVSVYSGYVLGC